MVVARFAVARRALASGVAMKHHRSCNLCEAMCGIVVEHEGHRVVSIKGDPDDPLSRGYICPKATALEDLYTDPDRLKKPLRKRGNDFEEISWDTAFDEVTARIRDLQKKHGRSALAVYQGNPTVHSVGALAFGQIFVRALHTRSHFSATSMDQLPHQLAGTLMFGNQFLLPIPDVDRTRAMIIVGANPLASNGSIMTAPGMKRRLREIQERGGVVVVVDPRKTETAAVADRHVPIRPGTDAALLLAMLKLALDDVRLHHLAPFVDGVDALKSVVRDVDIDQVARFTRVSVDDIRFLAATLAKSPAVLYGRMGACTQEFGGLTAWLLVVLNAVTGNLDREGGAMFTTPAVDLVRLAARGGAGGHFAKRKSRVRGLPEFGGEYPVSTLAEEIDTPGEGQLKGLITAAGNPVLSSPQGSRLDAALPLLELMVSVDPYVNETTRHAHYVLPPTSPLERDNYDVVFHALAVRNTARWSDALFERPHDARHDWEIFLELSTRLQRSTPGSLAMHVARRALRKRGPRPLIDVLLRLGPHRLSVKKLQNAPHGIDLGALVPRLPQALETVDKRIDLAPRVYVDDVARLTARIAADADAGLVMIGRRDLRSNNSWMHNSARLIKGADRCTLLMHPDDAKERNLVHGADVAVSSRTGRVTVKLEVTDAMMRGVVSLPHGFGHGRAGVRLAIAGAHAGVSLNDLTDAERVDPLSGNAAFNGLPVTVTSLERT
jgi:anaerobic selenocysteine-containing dehydrogenase